MKLKSDKDTTGKAKNQLGVGGDVIDSSSSYCKPCIKTGRITLERWSL